jgi:hypothetical protein
VAEGLRQTESMPMTRCMRLVISSRAAANALSADQLGARDIAILMLIGQVFLTVLGYISLYLGSARGLQFFVEAAFMAAISGWGILYCYRRNGGESGKRFAEKFLVLSTPIGWKIALLGWPALFLLSSVLTHLTLDFSDEQFDSMLSWVDVAWNSAMSLLFFLRLGRWMALKR